MAHECPECGQSCHCGGDIECCDYGDVEAQLNCTHCDDADETDDEDLYEMPSMTPTLQDRARSVLQFITVNYPRWIVPNIQQVQDYPAESVETIREALRLAADPWMPIETAPRDVEIDIYGYLVEKGGGEKIYFRRTNHYISANTVYPFTTTNFETDDGTVGTYYKTHWMPLPAAPVATTEVE